MPAFRLLVLSLLLAGCKPDAVAETSPAPASAPTSTPASTTDPADSPVPANSAPMAGRVDDLNGDGRPDRYEVIVTERNNDGLGLERELHFYTVGDDDPWYVATQAVLSTEHGGMMGDPFEGVEVSEDGTVSIHHFGGSREKWTYAHAYRWRGDDFKLVAATIIYGAACDGWTDFEYDLLSGKAYWKKVSENCEEKQDEPQEMLAEKSFIRKTDLPSMNGFYPGNTEVRIPDTDEVIFF